MQIDFDTADFLTTAKVLSLIGFPCEIKRSSSLSGYHIKTENESATIFDDLKRQFLRERGTNLVLFGKKTYLKRIPDFKRTNIKKFARKVLRLSRVSQKHSWRKLESLNDFLEVRI